MVQKILLQNFFFKVLSKISFVTLSCPIRLSNFAPGPARACWAMVLMCSGGAEFSLGAWAAPAGFIFLATSGRPGVLPRSRRAAQMCRRRQPRPPQQDFWEVTVTRMLNRASKKFEVSGPQNITLKKPNYSKFIYNK